MRKFLLVIGVIIEAVVVAYEVYMVGVLRGITHIIANE